MASPKKNFKWPSNESKRHERSDLVEFFSYFRRKLQVSLQMNAEQSSDVFSSMLTRPDASDRLTDVQSTVELLNTNEFSQDSINQFAKKILTNKPPTLVSLGNLQRMPFLDDLKA